MLKAPQGREHLLKRSKFSFALNQAEAGSSRAWSVWIPLALIAGWLALGYLCCVVVKHLALLRDRDTTALHKFLAQQPAPAAGSRFHRRQCEALHVGHLKQRHAVQL